MKGDKGESKKRTEPLFPRLHVNDREKGGPRAPPRNKMALYEQLSIPSQRFNSSSHKAGNLVTSAPSIQASWQETSSFPPSDMPAQLSSHLVKMNHFQSSDNMSLNSMTAEFVRSSKRQAINDTPNLSGNMLHKSGRANVEKSCRKNFDNEDDFTVPTFVQSRTAAASNKNFSANESEQTTTLHDRVPRKSCSCSSPDSGDKPLKETITSNVKSSDIEQNHVEQRNTAALVNKDSENIPDSGRPSESSNFAKASSDQDEAGTVTHVESSDCDNGDSYRFIDINIVDKGDNSRGRKRSSSDFSLRSSQTARNEAHKSNEEIECEVNVSPEPENVDTNEVSEASFPESISAMVLSPDDVVGVIGPKHFWKARRAIVNQQRLFAIQVFELHRLIKVQKSLAASPDVIKIDVYLSETPSNISMKIMQVPSKTVQPENIEISHPTIQEAASQMQNESRESLEANTIQDLSESQTPRSMPSQIPSAPDKGANPCLFHPHQNQWLVPVVSPSEGLIYKPYPGPCPSNAGFMTPFYGSYPALSFPTVSMDFVNPAFGHLPYPQQPSIYFLPQCNFPITKPVMPSSAIEQVSMFVGLSSRHTSNSNCEVIPGQIQNPHPQEGSKSRDNSLISYYENAQGKEKNAEALLSQSEVADCNNRRSVSTDRGKQNHVIRVVPHNARLATESAARIFRSIQQERKQCDL